MTTALEAPRDMNAARLTHTPAGKSQRILVVEDEPVLRALYSRVLLRAGYKLDVAKDGAVGWEMLNVASYELLITDNTMPKVTGVELIGRVRSAGMTLPVIMASATAPSDAGSLEFAAILEKPFRMDALLQTVMEVFRCQRIGAATPRMRLFARRLLADETASGKPGEETHSAACRVAEKLRDPLRKLMGVGGFSLLLSRALALAGAEVPWLRALGIDEADGSLEGLDALEGALDEDAVALGEAVLVADLLWLLVTLIGSGITLQLLGSTWPRLNDLHL